MNLLKKILNSSLWLLIGNSMGRLAMFLANIFAARILSQESFGQFAMIRNTITMIEGIFSSSLGSITTKTIAENNSIENKFKIKAIVFSFFLINFFLSLLIMLIFIFYADYIVDKFFLNDTDLKTPLIISSFLLIANILYSFVQNSLIGFEKFKNIALNSITVSILSTPFIYILIFKFNLIGAIFSVLLYFSLDFIFKSYYLIRILNTHKLDFNIKNNLKEISYLLKASLPLILSLSISSIIFWYSRILIIDYDNNFSNIAIFDAAYQWLMVIMIITHASSSSILPKLSNAFGSKNKKIFDDTFKIGILINISIALVIALIFSIFSKEIMSIYGENYIKGYYILIILSFSTIFFTISITYNKFFISINKQWFILLSVFLSSIVMYSIIYLNSEKNIYILSIAFLAYYIVNSLVLYLIKRKI